MKGILKVAATPSSQEDVGDVMVLCCFWRTQILARSLRDGGVASTLCDEASHLLRL
jgi:hypothetical protein